jgi:ATP-dependent Clp protease ATP-binding subunit ClpA
MNENPNQIFTESCLKAINDSYLFAQKQRYEYLTVDNLMLFIAQTETGTKLFEAMNLNVDDFKENVINYLNVHIPKLSDPHERPQLTVNFNKTLEQAATINFAAGNQKPADEGKIIAALFELTAEESFVLNYFNFHAVTRLDIYGYLSRGKRKEASRLQHKEEETSRKFLDKYAVLLNKKVEEGKVDPIIGRSQEIEEMIGILAQRRKNNPILVGDPGVGKTAIIEGLAKRIVEGDVPESILNFEIYALDMPSVVAGTKYRGDFEEKLKGIIKEAASSPNIVLFIDEIHTLIGTGATNGTMDASNILKPVLSSGEIKVAGATTEEEYKKYFEKEAALARRFQKIFVAEPSEDEAVEILKGLKSRYEEFHKVQYDMTALKTAVNLTAKYINDRQLPDKAIDAIDMAGAQVKLSQREDKLITSKDISEVIAKMKRIPVSEVEATEKDKLKHLGDSLKKEIYGQDDAIAQVVNKILLSRAKLTFKDKPVGSFLFAGPSGVGKTELSRQLAEKMGIPLVRFDMSEYMEKHSVARLVGAPPGYIGFDQGGKLTDAIRKTPHCVLLLDEIEKAHPDIFNILLQVMDYAVLTDNNGNKADFKNVILIMTSNVGGQELSKNPMGFSDTKTVELDREEQIKKLFSPEFYNRMDTVVQFHALDDAHIINVVDKQLKKLQDKLLEQSIVAFVTPELSAYIAKNGFDAKLGARPIERFVEKNIAEPLSKEILFGKLTQGGEIRIDVLDGKINFDFLYSFKLGEKIADGITEILPELTKKTRKRAVRKDSENGNVSNTDTENSTISESSQEE